MKTLTRLGLTAAIVAGWGWAQGLGRTIEPLVQGKAAVWQLQDSDPAYVASQYGMSFGPVIHGVVAIIAILLLVAVWKGPVRRALAGGGGGPAAAAAIGLMLLLGSTPAWAYYAQSNYPEWDNILSNESGFLIPLMGENLDSQAEFQSIDYLRAKKVAAKRVQIPHFQLPKSSWTVDYYVPADQLILVDRTPVQREWNKDPAKGTNGKDEGFRCESRDSFPITTAITMAAYVTEQDAPAFLYHFGTNPVEGKRDDPAVIFASVVQGRSLAQVMDSNVRGKVHITLCNELARFDLNAASVEDDLFKHKNEIIENVRKAVVALYTPMGISVEYIGFSDELGYEPEIQQAINRVFKAQKEKEAAVALREALPVLQAEADMEVKRGLAKGLEKGLPALPAFVGDLGAIVSSAKDFLGLGAGGPAIAATGGKP